MRYVSIGMSLLVVLAATGLVGCPTGPAIKVTPKSLIFAPEDLEKRIIVEVSGTGPGELDLDVVADVDWLDVEPESDTITAGQAVEVVVSLNTAKAMTAPDFATGTITVTVEGILLPKTIEVGATPDYLTEAYNIGDGTEFDLQYTALTFTPDPDSYSFYSVDTQGVGGFFVDPSGGTEIDFGDQDPYQLALDGGRTLSLYGEAVQNIYVSSNGYIAYENTGLSKATKDEISDALENLLNQVRHFSTLGISALATAPLVGEEADEFTWKQTNDAIVITYRFGSMAAEALTDGYQVELMFDGSIRITYLNIDPTDPVLVGLSFGGGVPDEDEWVMSDLSSYNTGALKGVAWVE